MNGWERPLYVKGRKPLLFYAVFGESFSGIQLSRTRHRVDELPKSLQFVQYNIREHSEYITGFYSNQLGSFLQEKGDALFRKIALSPACLVIVGEVEDDSSFAYMRNAIGLVQSALEHNAAGVLDTLTFRWYTPQEWRDAFFAKERFEPLEHVTILASPGEDGRSWFHTRGMRKLGRPDLSVRNVPDADGEACLTVINRLIERQSAGERFSADTLTFERNGEELTVKIRLSHDVDSPDFNNESVEFDWPDDKVGITERMTKR